MNLEISKLHTFPLIPNVTICIVTKHPLAEVYISDILKRDPELALIPYNQFRESAQKPMCSLFILDTSFLSLPLAECARTIQGYNAETKCLTIHHKLSQEEVVKVLSFGICGCIEYERLPASLLDAVHSILESGYWFPVNVLQPGARRANRERFQKRVLVELTVREAQIWELVKFRLSNKEIAERLKIQESTVKFHVSNIFSKLGVGSRRDLAKDEDDLIFWQDLIQDGQRSTTCRHNSQICTSLESANSAKQVTVSGHSATFSATVSRKEERLWQQSKLLSH